MVDPSNAPVGFNEQDLAATEAMIRSAAGHVEPSQDLRPRVLEAAREKKTRHHLRQKIVIAAAACFLVALAIETGIYHSRLNTRTERQASAARAQLAETGEHRGNVAFGWGIVEFFIDLRAEQAHAINVRGQ